MEKPLDTPHRNVGFVLLDVCGTFHAEKEDQQRIKKMEKGKFAVIH
jgi:hypothetical protein